MKYKDIDGIAKKHAIARIQKLHDENEHLKKEVMPYQSDNRWYDRRIKMNNAEIADLVSSHNIDPSENPVAIAGKQRNDTNREVGLKNIADRVTLNTDKVISDPNDMLAARVLTRGFRDFLYALDNPLSDPEQVKNAILKIPNLEQAVDMIQDENIKHRIQQLLQ